MRTMLRGKIHRATITRADLDYDGSISIDQSLMAAAGIAEWEQVDVLDITNGARLTTYAITAPPGSGEICINGAAAHLVAPGDLVIVVCYQGVPDEATADHHPHIVHVNEQNHIVARPPVPGITEQLAAAAQTAVAPGHAERAGS